MRKKSKLHRALKKLSLILGVVLVWRGVWYVFDEIDALVFGGSHLLTALGGILLGLTVLYLPDRTLEEIENI